MDPFISGLAAGWLIELLLDFFFWRRRRVCTEAEEQLQQKVGDLQAESNRLRQALDECEPGPGEDREDEEIEREWDNLTRIWGVGPKIAGMLYLSGITSFAALARLSEGQIKEVLSRGGERFRLTPFNAVESWAIQAQLAATEQWAELDAVQAQLSHEHSHDISGDKSHSHSGADL